MPDIDDGFIGNDAYLLRRIHPTQVVEDKNSGLCRSSSAAFRDPEMPVDVEPLLHARDLDWRFSLRNNQEYSLVRFVASVARQEGQAVIYKPEDDNEAHCEVVGPKNTPVIRVLKEASEWVRIGTKGPKAQDCEVPEGVAVVLE